MVLACSTAEVKEFLCGGEIEGVFRGCCHGSCGNEVAIEVGEHSRFHGLTSVVPTARDGGGVNSIVGLVEPFVFALAAVDDQSD